jgi:hypothetical protein
MHLLQLTTLFASYTSSRSRHLTILVENAMVQIRATSSSNSLAPENIFCADVGSVSRGRFGWSDACEENDELGFHSGKLPSQLVWAVAAKLNAGRAVALGFECPLFVPLSFEDEKSLGKARGGEGMRSWSAGAGCGALATGLVQVAWILHSLRPKLVSPVPVFVDWAAFRQSSGLFLWEAFVSSTAKVNSHIGDAQAGARAFLRSLPKPTSSITCEGDALSLLGAALLRTEWVQDPAWLGRSCLVAKA